MYVLVTLKCTAIAIAIAMATVAITIAISTAMALAVGMILRAVQWDDGRPLISICATYIIHIYVT